jgi:hypothetical protein
MLKTVIEICVLLAIEAVVLVAVFRLYRKEGNPRARIGYVYIATAVSVAIIIVSRFIAKTPEESLLVMAVVVCGFAGTISRMVASDLSSKRPIVRVWTYNRVTGVNAEADWQLFWSLGERLTSAYPPDYNDVVGVVDLAYFLRGRRPIILFTAFFTDDENQQELLGRFLTGGMNDYRALVRGCRVERTKMFLPTNLVLPTYRGIKEQGFVPLTLAAAYRLVHGPDAVPPAKIEAPEPPAQTAQANA